VIEFIASVLLVFALSMLCLGSFLVAHALYRLLLGD
jgi:hypothetical protein